MDTFVCHDCGKEMLQYYGVNLTIGEEMCKVCYHCYNQEFSTVFDLDIDMIEVNRKSFIVKDCDGKEHFFRVRKELTSIDIRLEAQEFIDGEFKGYNFECCGDFECDQLALEDELYKKVVQGLSYQSINRDSPIGDRLNDIVYGQVSYDDSRFDRMPLVVIDGREYSWEAFGQMMSIYEGWKFKLTFE